MKRLTTALVACLVATGCVSQAATPAASERPTPASTAGASTPGATPTGLPTTTPTIEPSEEPAASDDGPTNAQLIGQKLVIRMDGVTPSADLLGRIGRGEVGGVVLFGANISTRSALSALTASLQGAAATGGQPPLLIAVDQEGGALKRIPWAPPTLTVPQMGRDGASVAEAQGESTGTALSSFGINVDLAPVADVPAASTSFMYRDGRTFSFTAATTAEVADAFATGLESTGVLPTMKHFPGLGFATKDTDFNVVTITAPATALAPGLTPYQTAIAHDIPLIMLSNATYSAYDPANAAGWSPTVAGTLLRQDLGFAGVTITDSLTGTAHARGIPTTALALRAAEAGVDLILVTGSELTSRTVYAALLAAADDGSITAESLQDSYDRILALKSGL